jgi:bifunctional enzyme CysN/CysC
MPQTLLRVVMCGAVDDGKSTLLGRLLVETGSVPQDEISASLRASAASGSSAPMGTLDFSLLVDGLESEREQGITIDVAHRHLKLPSGRRAILADSPGHEQYTRNMAVASSTADVAVLVVDATRGVREQTLRHATVCALMGVDALVVAVNKLDACDDPVAVFTRICEELRPRLTTLVVSGASAEQTVTISFVALSGLRGDNVTTQSKRLPAGDFPSLLAALEDAAAEKDARAHAIRGTLRLPIQAVIRSDVRRRLAGRIARGSVRVGDRVGIWPLASSSAATVMATVVTLGAPQDVRDAVAGDSVTVELDRELDAGRGDIIVSASDTALPISRAHLATLVWLDTEPLDTEASYILRAGPAAVPARVEIVRYVADLISGEQLAGRPLQVNDIGVVEVTCDRAILLDSYIDSHDTGGFILVDRLTSRTVAAGMSLHPLARQSDVTRHSFTIDRAAREQLNGVRSRVLWLTGLPGSGKSTIADKLEEKLFERGVRSYVLDGDTVRQTLSEDLGFSPEDRAENVRRVARTAQLMMDAGLIVIVSLVSPFAADRALAREMFADTDFIEGYVDTPLDVCVARDPKGLYARAAASLQTEMTGIGQSYEAPKAPDIVLDGTKPVETSVEVLLTLMARRL